MLAIGGSTRPGSSSERAVRLAGEGARAAGADVVYITGRDLILPIYDTESSERDDLSVALVEALRTADGVIVASPGYHGGISGMIKNALDYAEDLAKDERPYLDGRAIGCIAVAYGWQATVSTLHQLRQVGHALRAWPTPLGGSVNAGAVSLSEGAEDAATKAQLEMIGRQVAEFAFRHQTPAK
ncbi:MAG: FMN reductase [Actinobacteria bacterium]|nr:FMN reductase [Actinomycetota bacterium]